MIKFLFSLSIFLSAYLIFFSQPLLAKKILPAFGGSSFVWISSISFFQIGLLLGYIYAYLLCKLKSSFAQIGIHFILMLASLYFLPLQINQLPFETEFWPPFEVILTLSQTILLPFVLLSASSPLLQNWYCQIRHTPFPYYYYAISNVGSLLGLLAYPFMLEPLFGIQVQMKYWSWLFALYLLFLLGCAVSFKHNVSKTILPDTEKKPTSMTLVLIWLLLTFISSALLLIVSQFIAQEIINLPLLWVFPLVLFLISYIVTFRKQDSYDRVFWFSSWVIWIGAFAWLTVTNQLSGFMVVLVLFMVLYSGCMICHGELIRQRAEWTNLTHFYLIIALGGVLGGVFVNFIAVPFFNEWWDFYLIISLISLIVIYETRNIYKENPIQWHKNIYKISYFGIFATGLICFTQLYSPQAEIVAKIRNTYGFIKIQDKLYFKTEQNVRELLHGNILHGIEVLNQKSQFPISYYSNQSGVGLAIEYLQKNKPSISVGVIGLGVGTLSYYGREKDIFQFYEIDQDIVHVAKRYFNYLKTSSAKIKINLGDGRLQLQKQFIKSGSNQFDLMVLDAFSGDVIPFHLMTQEAMEIYQKHLAENGIIAFHISNYFLGLKPVVQGLANACGCKHYSVLNKRIPQQQIYAASWSLVSCNNDFSSWLLQQDNNKLFTLENVRGEGKTWTDDKNSILSLVRLSRI